MEKALYTLWRKDAQTQSDFCQSLREKAPTLSELNGVNGVQLNLDDEAVAPAAGLKMQATQPQPHAIVSLWFDSVIYRQEAETILKELSSRFAGHLVTESQPLVNRDHTAALGERMPGMAQMVFLQKPPRLSREDWLDIWHHSHTQIAIDTQDTFLYVQNVIVKPLTYAAPHYDAVIEEGFHEGAMTDPAVFYDAVGDDDKLAKHQQAMIESCTRFIDFDKIDVMPTSQYVYKHWRN